MQDENLRLQVFVPYLQYTSYGVCYFYFKNKPCCKSILPKLSAIILLTNGEMRIEYVKQNAKIDIREADLQLANLRVFKVRIKM